MDLKLCSGVEILKPIINIKINFIIFIDDMMVSSFVLVE